MDRRACQAHSPGGRFCGMSGWRRENRGKGGEPLLFPRLLTGGEAARREFRWMRRQLDEEAEFRHFFRTGLKPGQKERRDVL